MPDLRTPTGVDERRQCRHRRPVARAVAVLAAALALFMVDFGAASPQPALALAVPPPGYHLCHPGSLGICKNAPSPPSTAQPGCGSGPGLLGSLIDVATVNVGAITKMATCGVVSTLFPQTSHGPGTWLIQSLVATPNYTQQGTNLAQVGENTSAIGLGVLGATMTFAVIEYWLSGLVKMGGMAGAEGIARGVGAAIIIAIWPWAFGQMVAVANALAKAVVAGGLQSRLGTAAVPWLTLGAVFIPAGATFGLIIGIVLFLAGLLLLLGLLLMKMAMGAALAVGYVAIPILVALGVVPSLSWLPRFAFKGIMTILIIPLVWALIFAVFTAFATDTLTFGNFHLAGAGVWGQLLYPLVTIMLFVILIFLPMKLAKMATLSSILPGGGGSVGSAFVGMTASRLATNAISSRMGGGGRSGGAGAAGAAAGATVPGMEAWEQDFRDVAGQAQQAASEGKAAVAQGDAALRGGRRGQSPDLPEGETEWLTNDEWNKRFDDWSASQEAATAGGTQQPAQAQTGTGISGTARANQAFGEHPIDEDAFRGSRETAADARKVHDAAMADPDPEVNAVAFEGAVNDAQDALGAFSAEQQSALSGIYGTDGEDSLRAYGTHLSYSPGLEPEQQDAALTLAGSDPDVLDAVLGSSSSSGDGSATAPVPTTS